MATHLRRRSRPVPLNTNQTLYTDDDDQRSNMFKRSPHICLRTEAYGARRGCLCQNMSPSYKDRHTKNVTSLCLTWAMSNVYRNNIVLKYIFRKIGWDDRRFKACWVNDYTFFLVGGKMYLPPTRTYSPQRINQTRNHTHSRRTHHTYLARH